MAKERSRDRMKIRSWTCRGYPAYQETVHPQLHKLLASLGGNSIFAELAITETIRSLTEEHSEEAIAVLVCIIANDLRITMRAEQGRFPVGFVERYMQAFCKSAQLRRQTPRETDADFAARTIGRILSPVEYALFDVNGKKVSLLFRFPFTKTGTRDLKELARKIYLEKDEVIYQT